MFDEMIASIREDAVHMLLTIEIRQQNAEPKREQIAKPTGEGAQMCIRDRAISPAALLSGIASACCVVIYTMWPKKLQQQYPRCV